MKKRDREENKHKNHHYPSTNIHSEVHTFAVKIFQALEGKNVNKKVFLQEMENAGYKMSERTFNHHIAHTSANVSALSTAKNGGAIVISLLSYDEKLVVAGFVFSQNSQNHEVHVEDYKRFVKAKPNVEISTKTANNYLHDSGFTNRSV